MDNRTDLNPHSVLAALADMEQRAKADPSVRERQYARHSLRGEAILQVTEDAVELRTVRVQLRDISLTGIGFVSSHPMEPGSVWRVTFVIHNFTLGQHAVMVRHCRRIDDGAYLSGAQFCIEPGLLHAMGVSGGDMHRGDGFDLHAAFLPPADVN